MKNQFDKEYSVTSALKDNYSKKIFEGPKPIKLGDFRTKEGVVRSRITKELRDYAINCEDLQKNSQAAYERLIDICEELMKDFDKTSETIVKVVDQLNYLYAVHKRFNDQSHEGKWELMQKMYQTMSNSISKWGKSG